MRLEKGMIKDVKLGREEVVGLKLNGTYLYETTGPSYWNIYTIQIPAGKAVQATIYDYDNATWKNENNYVPYIDWGVGEPITDSSGNRIFTKYYNNSTSKNPWIIKIKTTGELQASVGTNLDIDDFPGDYIKDIVSVRTDYLSGSSLFYNYSGLKTIREPVLERLNTGVFDNMGSMFYYCTSMEKLNLSSFNTSNVIYMSDMFRNCESLIELDISSFDTSKATTMNGMFWGCKSLKTLDLSNFNTSAIAGFGLGNMFRGCSSLEVLNISNFDLSNTNFRVEANPSTGLIAQSTSFLEGCDALYELRLDNCSKDTIEKIITSPHFPTNKMTGKTKTIYCQDFGLEPPINWVFNHNIVIEPEEPEIPLYEPYEFKEKLYTDVVTIVNESHDDLSEMFLGCAELVSVNTEDWNTSNVTNMSQMFFCCYDLPQLNLSNFNTSKVIDMSYMFSYCSSLNPLDLSSFNTIQVTDMQSMFRECKLLTSLDLSSFNTSRVIYMNNMFRECESLTSLDLSNFNTNLVTNMSNMFDGCTLLEELDIRNFDMSKVTSSYYRASMFANCNSLRILHLDDCSVDTISKIITSSNFPTGTINGENRIIYCTKEAKNLVLPEGWEFNFIDGEPDVPVDPPTPSEPEEPEIPLYEKGQFRGSDITEVVTMVNNTNSDLEYMFDGCTNLVSVNTQDWNVDNAGNMEGMFRNCSSIVNIDLSTVRDESGAYSVGAMNYMFAGCTSLETLDLRNFYISYADVEEDYITRNMFDGCTSLRTLYLNNCSAFTIDQIIKRLPYGKDWGGVIYIKQYNQNDEYREIYNVAPYGWRFEYVD
jgi:surface protein